MASTSHSLPLGASFKSSPSRPQITLHTGGQTPCSNLSPLGSERARALGGGRVSGFFAPLEANGEVCRLKVNGRLFNTLIGQRWR